MSYHNQPVTLGSIVVSFPRAGTWVDAQLADDEASRIRGLHGRTHLSPHEGMLFNFPSQTTPIFMTMEKMLMPLDFIYIDRAMIVRGTVEEVAPGGVVPGPAVPWVLEVESGFVKKHGIRVGDRIAFVSH